MLTHALSYDFTTFGINYFWLYTSVYYVCIKHDTYRVYTKALEEMLMSETFSGVFTIFAVL